MTAFSIMSLSPPDKHTRVLLSL